MSNMDDKNIKTVLVTGGAGYVGSILTDHLLDEGYRVKVIDNLMYSGRSLLSFWGHPKFEFIYGDIGDNITVGNILRESNYVVHLAAIVGDPASRKDTQLTWKVNYDASKNLIDNASNQGIEKFIFVSTCSNYGISSKDSYATEDSPLNPLSPYAESKVGVEKYLMNSDKTLDYTILRLATAYGVSPRMRFDLTVNDFTMQMATKKHLLVYGEKYWRPYVHIRDIAHAIQLVLEKPVESRREVFNVGNNDQNYRKLDIVNQILKYIPDANIEFRKGQPDPRDYSVSFDKVNKLLGFSTKKDIDDGIKETLSLIQNTIITDFENRDYYNA